MRNIKEEVVAYLSYDERAFFIGRKEEKIMFSFKKRKSPALTVEQAITKLSSLYPQRVEESYSIISGNYFEYQNRNRKCAEAIENGDRETYDQYDWLRRNSLHLALNECRRVAECLNRRFATNLVVTDSRDPEDQINEIADFCELLLQSKAPQAMRFIAR